MLPLNYKVRLFDGLYAFFISFSCSKQRYSLRCWADDDMLQAPFLVCYLFIKLI